MELRVQENKQDIFMLFALLLAVAYFISGCSSNLQQPLEKEKELFEKDTIFNKWRRIF